MVKQELQNVNLLVILFKNTVFRKGASVDLALHLKLCISIIVFSTFCLNKAVKL